MANLDTEVIISHKMAPILFNSTLLKLEERTIRFTCVTNFDISLRIVSHIFIHSLKINFLFHSTYYTTDSPKHNNAALQIRNRASVYTAIQTGLLFALHTAVVSFLDIEDRYARYLFGCE